MTMKPIVNVEYAAVDDINITITGYAIHLARVSGPEALGCRHFLFDCRELGRSDEGYGV